MKEIRQEVQDLEITVKEAAGGLEAETEQVQERETGEGILSEPEKEERRRKPYLCRLCLKRWMIRTRFFGK